RSVRFIPNEKFDMQDWQKKRNRETEERINEDRRRLSAIGVTEKSNKDEVFRPRIQKVDEDENDNNRSEFGDEDYILGIRPEFIKIDDRGVIDTKVYGAMPTGMESTLKLETSGYLLTSVVFGGVTFPIGSTAKISIDGDNILLYDRKSGGLICSGSLEF
ncbi:MAG: ABC transporter ATP-binding protein, partial [Lachnospiraceae bacterium]|nr:ABC transporter ATP-binding protein [Lachnospiraceae bacterium]